MEVNIRDYKNKAEMYDDMKAEITRLMEEGAGKWAILSNASAVIKLFLDRTNWVGFYLIGEDGETLQLGPFQGKPAVMTIAKGSGVCGTAVAEQKTQIVEDVHKCCNHIACDLASSSEIVVPIICKNKLVGVLDIDSPERARFDKEDAKGLSESVSILSRLFL